EIVVIERREVEFLFFSVFDFRFVIHDNAPDSDDRNHWLYGRVRDVSLGTALPAFWRARDIRLPKSDTPKARL
ncbi:MAG: hypothetical protein V3V86_02360, partial [Gammaproteobacteria bacterium]